MLKVFSGSKIHLRAATLTYTNYYLIYIYIYIDTHAMGLSDDLVSEEASP